MNKIKLILGTHNTQPVGNPDHGIERAYKNAYKPFLSVLYNFPEIPAAMHFSGTLLQWLEEHHPEFLDVLGEMINRKQVEILGGGFHEPVFPLVPNSDRIGQIESLTTFLRKRFGRRPRGSWITERVWEPSLASSLKNSGMDYTFLDDYHFLSAGVDGQEIFYPCQTEDQGKSVVVFPISYALRSLVPFGKPEAVIETLKSLASENEEKVAVLIDDGEKLGDWDNTYAACYEEKRLERLFTLLRENNAWIEMILPGKYLRQYTPHRKVYFPCTSYEEMMIWSLPPQKQKELASIKAALGEHNGAGFLISGGYFRQFLTKYPESNLLYSKMMYTHILVNQIRGDKYRKKAAREELWRGQCNTAYWHGRTGGLYSNNLRKEVYKSLIEAEKVTREKGVFIPSIISVDFDMDGDKEYLYQGHELNAYIHRMGAVIFELDYLPVSWNYLDTLSRYRETFHDKKISGGKFDTYMRKAFIDHIFTEKETINAFDAMTYREHGDFINQPYEMVALERNTHEILFRRLGSVKFKEKKYPLEIEKHFIFKGKVISVEYVLRNPEKAPLSFIFGSELNISLPGQNEEAMSMYLENGTPSVPLSPGLVASREITGLSIHDGKNGVDQQIKFSRTCSLWSLPVETLTKCPDGVISDYQSTCLVPRWNVALEAGESWSATITITFSGK